MASSARTSKTATPPPKTSWLLLLGVLALTAGVHAFGLGGELVGDDRQIVGRDPRLGDPSALGSYFAHPYWQLLGQESARPEWRPLSAAARSLAWATAPGPATLRILSLLVHLGATAAAFRLARRLARERPNAHWIAAACAAVFGVHSLQVEPVIWIAALSKPLSTALLFGALHAWVRWRDRDSRRVPWSAAAWFLAALLADEAAIVFLPAALAIDWCRGHLKAGGGRETQRAYGTAMAGLGLYLLARTVVFASPWGGLFEADARTNLGADALRLAVLRLELFGGSLGLLAWPAELTPFRPFRPVVSLHDAGLWIATAWTVLFAVAAGWLFRREARLGLSALLLIPAFFAPSLLRVTDSFPLHDRDLYPLVFGLALGLSLFAVRLGRVGAVAIGALLLVHAARSIEQAGHWTDEGTLFAHAAELAPSSPRVHWELGRVHVERYRASSDIAELARAEEAYERALELLTEAREPDSNVFATSRDYLQANLGFAWCSLLRSEHEGFTVAEPIAQFEELERRIEEIRERTAEARSLGIRVRAEELELVEVRTAIGVAYLVADDLDASEAALQRALEENPRYPEAHMTLGRLFMRREDWQLARRHFERALDARPNHTETRLLLAQALQSEGRAEEADRLAASIADGTRPEPFVVRAAVALDRGDARAALEQTELALDADSHEGQAWYLRGQALLLLASENDGARQYRDQAVKALRRATVEMPESFEAHYDLGITLVNLGGTKPGLVALARAYALCPDRERLEQMRAALLDFPHSSAESLQELAAVDLARGELGWCESWLERALALEPDHVASTVLRSRLLRQRGEHDQALELMRRATELDPTSFSAQAELASYLLSLERDEQARAAVERALEIGPPEDWPEEMARGATDALREELRGLGGS